LFSESKKKWFLGEKLLFAGGFSGAGCQPPTAAEIIRPAGNKRSNCRIERKI